MTSSSVLEELWKGEYTLEKRKKESERLKKKYPDRIPVIVYPDKRAGNRTPQIDKHKYLVPNDLFISEFLCIIRQRLHMKSEEALFFFINETIPSPETSLLSVYKEHASPDGFLYMIYTVENTFGDENTFGVCTNTTYI